MIKTRGYTRDHVAQQCGIKVDSLNGILRGRIPSTPVLLLLAQTLNTNVDYLTSKSDDPRSGAEVA